MVKSILLLKGKVAVVTGSGVGLGRAFATGLAKAGARVIVNATTAEHVTSTVDEIKRNGGIAEGCLVSVASMKGAQQLIQSALDCFGRVDILVNNAGINCMKPLEDMTEQEFDDVIAVNLKGTFACAKWAVPHMIRNKWGRIINVSSGAALGRHKMTGYAASKAGVLAMTTTWAQELTKHGITCNAIRAGAHTRHIEPILEEARQAAQEQGKPPPTPLDLGYYEPEAAAPLVTFLASDQAGWINGQFIGINGPDLTIWGYMKPAASATMTGGWTVELMLEHFKSKFGSLLQAYGTQYPRDVSQVKANVKRGGRTRG